MHLPVRFAVACLTLGLFSAACHKAPADPGERLFEERCASCHTTTESNGRGPGLANILGRKAGKQSGFAYSPALKASHIVWSRKTLNDFLASPGTSVPGTFMPIAVPDAHDRREIILYLSRRTGESGFASPPLPANLQQAPPVKPGLLTGKAVFGDYTADGPGLRRHLTVADLPKPFATDVAVNGPHITRRPAGFVLHVPDGFRVNLFADGFLNNRILRTAPNGDVFVVETGPSRIHVLRATDGADHPTQNTLYAAGLEHPFGVAFYPPGPNPSWLYVANQTSVVRFPYQNGDLVARGAPETIVPKLPGSGGHSTRDIAFSLDGKRMFISVGSASNDAEGLRPLSSEELKKYEAERGFGAAWGPEDERADVLVFDPNGIGERTFATGIRNCVGEAINPTTGDLWCATNERDALGDNLVPDYVTRVRQGQFFGWPWFYMGDIPDPRHVHEREDLPGHITVPDVLLQPHSASLEMVFYEGTQFPPEYRGNAFVALHGSWNRHGRTGYKVVRAIVKDGIPTGEYEDFLTGFVVNNDYVWGRPVGVTVMHDGALLVGEDGNSTIWRVSYGGK